MLPGLSHQLYDTQVPRLGRLMCRVPLYFIEDNDDGSKFCVTAARTHCMASTLIVWFCVKASGSCLPRMS